MSKEKIELHTYDYLSLTIVMENTNVRYHSCELFPLHNEQADNLQIMRNNFKTHVKGLLQETPLFL